MTRTILRPSRIRKTAVAALAVTATAALVFAPTAANAVPFVTFDYPISGTTHIKKANADLALGPGTLHTVIDLGEGPVTGNLQIPPASGTWKLGRHLRISATATVVEQGTTTGTIDLGTGALRTSSNVVFKLSGIKVGGKPVPVGDRCQSVAPTTIGLASGDGWHIIEGGTLSGTYTIPRFANCGDATTLINSVVPGAGNTIRLTAGTAVVPS